MKNSGNKTRKYALLPSAEGKIEKLLIVIPGFWDQDVETKYDSIISQFQTWRTLVKFRYIDIREEVKDQPEKQETNQSLKETYRDGKHLCTREDSFSYEVSQDPDQQTRTFNPDCHSFGEEGKVEDAHRSIPDSRESEKKYEDYIEETHRGFVEIAPNLKHDPYMKDWVCEMIKALEPKNKLKYSRWAQDPFAVLQGPDGIVLLQSYFQRRFADYFLPIHLADNPNLEVFLKPSSLLLEGGNILCSGNRAFIGKDLVNDNLNQHANKFRHLERSDLKRQAVLNWFEKELGVDLVVEVGSEKPIKKNNRPQRGGGRSLCGEDYQPLFHLDLYLTMGGGNRDTGKEIVFVGSTKLTKNLFEHHLKQISESEQKRFREVIKDFNPDEEIDSAFEEVFHFFNDSPEFEVYTLPLFFYESRTYSWNNSLIEVYNEGKMRTAYLPSYQVPGDDTTMLNQVFEVLEEFVEKEISMAKFEVKWLTDGKFFRRVVSHGGSLHCVTKVLERSYS